MNEIKPSLNEVIELTAKTTGKSIVSMWSEIIADLETPVSAFNKICKDEKYSFLLESAEGNENFGRFSYIGCDPLILFKSDQSGVKVIDNQTDIVIKEGVNPFDLMDQFLADYTPIDSDLPFSPGFVGYYGYDCIKFVEPKLEKLFNSIEDCTTFPNAYFMLAGSVVVFDHYKHKIYVINNIMLDNEIDAEKAYELSENKILNILTRLGNAHDLPLLNLSSNGELPEVTSNISKDEWSTSIARAKEHILAGDIFQVVLSQRFCVPRNDLDTLTIYRGLRSINPSPYMYYLNFDEFQIIGSSPEIMVKSDGEYVQIRPIAGTRKRGNTPEEDIQLQKELLDDKKEVAEHVMLVDLGRNDLGRVCEYGSVKVSDFMSVEKYSHVQHIVSNVSGKIKKGVTPIDLIKATYPAGTMSGAPKVRAMELIYELEKSARGPYAGCIGFIGLNNKINTAITIRTMLVKDDKIFIQAGAGIVADSVAENEYKETQSKAAALVQTISQLTC